MSVLPQLKLNPPSRSNFDLSYKTRFTAAPGVLYPIMVQRCLPGDHFEFNMYHLVKTLAMKAPLMGRMSLNFDVFFCADRLMMPEFRNGRIAPAQFASKPSDSLGMPNVGGTPNTDFVYPFFRLPPVGISSASAVEPQDLETPLIGVAPSSLMDFLGLPVGFADWHNSNVSSEREVIGNATYNNFNINSLKFNAMPWLQFWNIYLNYYINPQESSFAVMTAGDQRQYADNSTYARPITRDAVAAWQNNPYSFETALDVVPVEQFADVLYQFSQGEKDVNTINYLPFRRMFNEDVATKMGGLPLRCYRPDYFSNFISSQAYNASVNSAGSVVINDGKFTMTQVRFANKLQKLAERVFVAGSRYGEFIRALFGVNTNSELDVPEFLGSVRKYMDFQDIVNHANVVDPDLEPTAENSSQFLGGSAGRGISSDASRKFYVNATEYGYLYVMFSIVPEPDYFEGVHKSATKIFFSDEFNPQLDRLGWQPLFESEYFALGKDFVDMPTAGPSVFTASSWSNPAEDPFKTSFVYQPAWLEYMTRTNELHGEFTTSLNFWTLGRTFNRSTYDGTVSDVTPTAYIYPGDYSTPFVDQSISAQNFMVQVGFDLFARRPISKKLMPNLG